jgi:hypothetical protein
MTYLNNMGLASYNPTITIYDGPGTFGYLDTAAHESFHAALYRYMPFVTWIEDTTIGGVSVGRPVLWAEETLAYAVGRFSAGRIFAVPLAPGEAYLQVFGTLPAMTGPQTIVSVSAMVVGSIFMAL